MTAPGGRVLLVTWCHRELRPGEAALSDKELRLLRKINQGKEARKVSGYNRLVQPTPTRNGRWTGLLNIAFSTCDVRIGACTCGAYGCSPYTCGDASCATYLRCLSALPACAACLCCAACSVLPARLGARVGVRAAGAGAGPAGCAARRLVRVRGSVLACGDPERIGAA